MIRFGIVTLLGMLVTITAGCGANAAGVNIWEAVQSGDIEAIKSFAQADGDLNVKDFSGSTPLWVALTEKNRASYEALLKYGADPNVIMSGKRVVTHWAAIEDDPWWLRLALEHGADSDLVNTGTGKPSEGTPLSWAISQGPLDNVKLLAKHGADLNKSNQFGCPPLVEAADQTKFAVALFLLEEGADYHHAKCGETTFLEMMRQKLEHRNRWFRLEEDRKAIDAVRAWLEARGEDLGEPLPAD